MNRPDHLPNFQNPPVDEVVVGVQFGATPKFLSVNYGDVWSIFKDQYPIVQEQELLVPQFETFGGMRQGASVQFNFGPQVAHNRLWFVSEDQNHLIQFQRDRLLTNWRKRTGDGGYPRFETILKEFEQRYGQVASYFTSKLDHSLTINQCEVSYFNIIPVDDFSEIGRWLSCFGKEELKMEGIAATFDEVLKDSEAKPFARIYYEIQSVTSVDGLMKAIRFTLTVRGAPEVQSLDSAIRFLTFAREKIVTRFTEITTSEAHIFWERTS